MPFTFEKNSSVGVLKLYGDFTARNASNVKKAFFVGLSNSEHLIMDFKGVSKIDGFFLDQIFSLKKISKRTKKRLTIINFHPDIFEKMVAKEAVDGIVEASGGTGFSADDTAESSVPGAILEKVGG